ncbi:unnamed protein product [Rangifer tarandus platyrhynchus]|uniref:Uncharacterized protein n=1 Tax=Rangifer tarandus platyrhynchus TaxID=3082113 RepID=A0ABN8ZDF7_RANTA|nr:unnamed protein product [Rangifer tarandus platyrhynchus]
MRYFFKSFQFRLVTGYFFFFPQPHSVGNPCELPGKGKKKKASWKGEKKRKLDMKSVPPLIPCPHLPAFHTHTPPCSMCNHPCQWTEPSRMRYMASGHTNTPAHAHLSPPLSIYTDFTVMSEAV